MPVRTLIVTAFFSPVNVIASVRVGKLAKYLARQGHAVTVATFDPEAVLAGAEASARSPLVDPAAEGIRIVHFPPRPTKVWHDLVAVTLFGKEHGVTRRGPFVVFLRARSLLRLYGIYRGCRGTVRALFRQDPPDALLTSYGPHFALWLGLYAKRLRPGLRWVADLRDPVVNARQSRLMQRFDAWLERRYVERADRIVVVSDGMKERLVARYASTVRQPDLADRIDVVSNGYDPEDLVRPEEAGTAAPGATRLSRDGRLHLVYTGYLYGANSDASPLFRAIAALVARSDLPVDAVRLHYAGKNFDVLHAQAAACGQAALLVDHGFLPRAGALALQRDADLLLLLSWNYRDEQGVMTGKIYEYFLSKRPILALVRGDVPGSAVARLVRDARAGFVYEQANDAQDGPSLERFVLEGWRSVQAGRPLGIEPDGSVVGRYAYPELARRYGTLLEG